MYFSVSKMYIWLPLQTDPQCRVAQAQPAHTFRNQEQEFRWLPMAPNPTPAADQHWVFDCTGLNFATSCPCSASAIWQQLLNFSLNLVINGLGTCAV